MGNTVRVNNNIDVLDFNSRSFEERGNELEKVDEFREKINKREKNSPYSRWTQFNLEKTKELMWLAIKYPKAHAILYFLVDQMDHYNAVMCSSRVLEEVLGIGRATVSRSIKVLKEHGFIAIMKSGTSNVYTINDRVYWKSFGYNLKLSKFPANVVLSISEQDGEIQKEAVDIGYSKLKEINIK